MFIVFVFPIDVYKLYSIENTIFNICAISFFVYTLSGTIFRFVLIV